MSLVNFLCGIGVVQGVVMAGVLLYAHSGHRLANAIMATLVLATAAILLQKLLIQAGVFQDYPQFSIILSQLRFTWGPLLYLYALSITGTRLNYRHCWHFLPAIVFFTVNNLKFWQLDPDQQRLFTAYLWNYLGSDPTTEAIIWSFMGSFWRALIESYFHFIFFALQSTCYGFLVLRLIRNHNKRLEQHFSSLEHMNLRWLRLLTITFLAVLGLLILFNRLPLLLNLYDLTAPITNAYAVLLVALFYAVAISALLQPSLISGVIQAKDSEPAWLKEHEQFSPPEDAEGPFSGSRTITVDSPVDAENAPVEPDTKYKRSKMSSEDGQRYKIKLMQVMQKEQLYLDSDLTLPELAEAADLTAPQASQVLNGQMNQNFFSFVNNYRIDLARRILLAPETANIPIVDLAAEVGFKSKSSFYDAFKRATSMTPTQFKRAMTEAPATETLSAVQEINE
ncbi:helix-turn-helix domain-containing protein [Microbulbifer agarilyticus]|uniref:helix-turn-helix domain-containing protein n=1 Tax=Microbulbifer agarilyticus TaxID=260552 RepID=UPI001CD7819D|nr:helix-turn-helix domain-containing protein [Microbulbifer agarilyticus]MCA0901208.1 helix-turn-helix domain-containing protein [Microbulbifer agarilyticus]